MEASIQLFPEFATDALCEKREPLHVAWALLRALDAQGVGRLSLLDARTVIATYRGQSLRQAQRTLAAGEGTFWTVRSDVLILTGAAKLAEVLGIPRVRKPHLVPICDISGPIGRLRAHLLAAACYRTDDKGRPLSAALVEGITGMSPATQRRLNAQWGAVVTVARPVVRVRNAGEFIWHPELQSMGLFVGTGGHLFQQLPFIRRAPGHRIGSWRIARHVNRKLARSRDERPLMLEARGRRSPRLRAYFAGTNPEQRWQKTRLARGKVDARKLAKHPLLDHSIVMKGNRFWVVRREWTKLSGDSEAYMGRRPNSPEGTEKRWRQASGGFRRDNQARTGEEA